MEVPFLLIFYISVDWEALRIWLSKNRAESQGKNVFVLDERIFFDREITTVPLLVIFYILKLNKRKMWNGLWVLKSWEIWNRSSKRQATISDWVHYSIAGCLEEPLNLWTTGRTTFYCLNFPLVGVASTCVYGHVRLSFSLFCGGRWFAWL